MIHHSNARPIDRLLNRLERVTERQSKKGLNQWQALCPAHGDKTPSLAITECHDGTVLVKCWAGCQANEIVKALGLTLKDLFNHSTNSNHSHRTSGYKKQPHQKAIQHEQWIAEIAYSQLVSQGQLSAEDLARYRLALKRLRLINRGQWYGD